MDSADAQFWTIISLCFRLVLIFGIIALGRYIYRLRVQAAARREAERQAFSELVEELADSEMWDIQANVEAHRGIPWAKRIEKMKEWAEAEREKMKEWESEVLAEEEAEE